MTWVWPVFTFAFRRIMTYRADFWVQFLLSPLTQVLISFFLWTALFESSGKTELGGYTFAAMFFYAVLAPLVDSFVSMNFMVVLSDDIYKGTLTRFLLYPANVFLYKFTEHLSVMSMGIVKTLPALGVYFYFFDLPADVHITLASVSVTLGLLVMGSTLYFFMVALTDLLAFWADNVWSLLVFLRFLLQFLGGLYLPLTLVPEPARAWLMKLPFAHIYFVPIQILIGKLPLTAAFESLGILMSWGAGIGIALWLGWRQGMLRYTGAGI